MASSCGIVVIGGSSGALEALRVVAAGLPPDLEAAVFVVIHTSPNSPGVLDRILSRAGLLPARYAVDGEPIVAGRIYVARADRHLLIGHGRVRLTRGPRENRFRPAVDPLFRTAAAAYGSAVLGVILSGGQDDGATGLGMIKTRGGLAIVQDPADAVAPGMPTAAISHVAADYIVPAADMSAVITRVVRDRIRKEAAMKPGERRDVAEAGAHDIHRADALGPPSPFTCPDCGGTLWQSQSGELVTFQCHVGHRYAEGSLDAAQAEALDHALWAALRALEESAELRRRMARHAFDRGMKGIGDTCAEQAVESERRALAVRAILMPESGDAPDAVEPRPAGTTT